MRGRRWERRRPPPAFPLVTAFRESAPEGTRTPNLLIRSSGRWGWTRQAPPVIALIRSVANLCGAVGCCTSVLCAPRGAGVSRGVGGLSAGPS